MIGKKEDDKKYTLYTSQIIVGTVQSRLPFLDCKRVMLKSSSANVGNTYLGDSSVQVGSGYQIIPGEVVEISINKAQDAYLVSDTQNELFYVLIEIELRV